MPLTITIQDIRARHPKGVKSPTDFYYGGLANKLLSITGQSLMSTELTQEMRKRIALCVTLYFEDVICDSGIWRSFIAKNRELYGRRLPFYDTPDGYQPDEPYLEDVKLVVWDAIMTFKYESVVNPENLGLSMLAEQLFYAIDTEFERAPINEALANYFRQCRFMSDFYHMRDALKFFVLSCYLTNGRHVESYLNYQIEMANEIIDQPDLAYYEAECAMAWQYRIGPLALLPEEWLGMALRAVGRTAEANDVESIRWRDYEPYLVEHYDSKGFTLRSVDDELFPLTYHNMAQKDDSTVRQHGFVMAMFAYYRGEWYLNGPASWNDGKEIYNEVREYKRKSADGALQNYAEVVKKNDGSPLFYFKNIKEAIAFMKQATGAPFTGKIPKELNENDKDVVLFLSPTNHIFAMAPEVAECICDQRNPYYDKRRATERALLLVCQNAVPGEMLHYLIAHDMLPDACLKSTVSAEHGRLLMQKNIDFFARTLRRDDYYK